MRGFKAGAYFLLALHGPQSHLTATIKTQRGILFQHHKVSHARPPAGERNTSLRSACGLLWPALCSPTLSWLNPLLCPTVPSQPPASADSMGMHVGQRSVWKRLSCKQGVAPDSKTLALRYLSLPARLAGAAHQRLG